MVLGQAPFFGEEIQHLGSMMAAGVDGAAGGMAENIDLNAAYLDAITAAAGEITGLDDQTVIWDCGNGATGPLTEALTANWPVTTRSCLPRLMAPFPIIILILSILKRWTCCAPLLPTIMP